MTGGQGTGEPFCAAKEAHAVPVVVGLAVDAEERVTIAYSCGGFARLLGREPTGDAATALSIGVADKDAFLASVRESARKRGGWRFTWRVRDATGGELTLHALARALAGPDGTTTLHGYVRAAHAEELEMAAARFRSIVEASPVPYAINDDDQNITYVNPAFVATFGYSLSEIPTLSHWWPLAYPDPAYREWILKDWQARIERARETNTPFDPVEVKIQAKDGTPRYAIAGALWIDSRARGTHVVVLLDITERKLAEEARLTMSRQVQHSQKLESLGILAGGIAHDFNNLLMAIVGNAGVALANLPEGSAARASVEAIQVSARRASEVADQMLAYSGKGTFVVSPLSLSELASETLQLLQIAIPKHVTFQAQLEKAIPLCDGDATQVRQVVMNLITNAAEAIGEQPGVVRLETGEMMCDRAYLDRPTIVRDRPHRAILREGRYVYLSVSDSGCGMTPETVGRIFEPFFTTKFTGRGLGLSAVLGIVHGHAGAIEIHTEVGAGTTFKVLFPVSTAAAQKAATHARATTTDEPAHKGLILLVDDEEAIRAAVAQMLELLGYDVLLAANGKEAIAMFRDHPDVSAVVLDLTMPVLSGEQTFRGLRTVRSDVKVILSSGYSNSEVSRRFASGDLAGFLKKPFDLEDLEQVLAQTLR